MLLQLPRPPSMTSLLWKTPAAKNVLSVAGGVDFSMESVHLAKRRVRGGVSVHASQDAVWERLVAFETLPDIIPSLISHKVTRKGDGTATIEQVSLLSRRLNLRSQMTLEAVPNFKVRELVLRRIAGHGFLEFEAIYRLVPKPDGTTYLSYVVNAVPCPIFPMPVVESKIRREVPSMLLALKDAVEEVAAI